MPPLSRHYVKLCDVADFEDPALLAAIREILPERDPLAHIERKVWEYAMLALFCADVGVLDDHSEALGVGAGDERILFWLANRVGRVVATDIYGQGEFSEHEAHVSMLEDPRSHAPFPYREDRLEVRWMEAGELQFPDESFDLVFCMSSIEHFGAPRDIAEAAREVGRVLRRGGHAFITTDCFVRRHPLNAAPVDFAVRALTLGVKRGTATPRRRNVLEQMFTPRELRKRIVEPSGLRLMQPLDTALSPQAWHNLTRIYPDGRTDPETGEKFPHILLKADHSVLTSVCLALEKPARHD